MSVSAPPFADAYPDVIIAKMDGFDKDDVKECYAELKELYSGAKGKGY